jgi:Protein of unknown function (DUF3298)
MMRKISTFFVLIFIFSSSSFTQNYSIEYKSIKKKNKAKNYEISIGYSQIKGLNNASEKGYNRLLESIAKGQADTFKVWMQDWESPPGFEQGSFYELGDTVLYNDSKIVSTLFYEFYYFSGAAHPNNSNFSVNYDIGKNREMKLNDLFTGEYLKKLSELCIEEVAKTKKGYAPDYDVKDDEWLNSGAGPDEKNFKVFNITKDNFVITFPTYQVASYAEGPQTVEISYSRLKDIINPDGPLKEFVK